MGIAGLLGGYLVEHWVTSQNAMGVFYILVGITMLIVLIVTKSALSAERCASADVSKLGLPSKYNVKSGLTAPLFWMR